MKKKKINQNNRLTGAGLVASACSSTWVAGRKWSVTAVAPGPESPAPESPAPAPESPAAPPSVVAEVTEVEDSSVKEDCNQIIFRKSSLTKDY